MSIERSVQAIAQKMKAIYEDMLIKETQSLTIQPMGLNSRVFSLLRGKISLRAIYTIWDEYLAVSNLTAAKYAQYDVENDYDSCACEARLQYSLPYRHIVILVLREYAVFPLQIIYLWWKL